MAIGVADVSAPVLEIASFFDSFGGAVEFIFSSRAAEGGSGGLQVGGTSEVWELFSTQAWLSAAALVLSVIVAMPIGAYFGHRGSGELLAVAIGNAGRAIPELALIALMVAFVGVGNLNVTIALLILGIPPILTNSFVGMRQVDQGAVEAARGIGMTEWEIVRKVELPLAVPTIMSGIRTSSVNIIATATIASLAGVSTLGDFIINVNVYGDEGVLAGAILVAVMALTAELLLALAQRALTPRGLTLQRAAARASA